MATTAVDIVVKVVGNEKLKQLDSGLNKIDKTVDSLKGDLPRLSSDIKNVGRGAKQAGNDAKRGAAGFEQLKKSAGALLTIAAAIQATKFVVVKTAELETQTRSLKVLTGELSVAKTIIRDLQGFAAVTPFRSAELIDTAKRLAAFGVETEKLVDITKRLGDVSGATGADLGGVATAFGQIIAKGRLQGEELLQLQERGIGLQGELQKMYGLTGEEFRKALEKGRFSAEAVEVALKNLTNEGGKYANGAIAQSDTLAGRFSTLQDGIEQAARELGKSLTPAFETVLRVGLDAVSQLNKAIKGMSGIIKDLEPVFTSLGQVAIPVIRGIIAAFRVGAEVAAGFGRVIKNIQEGDFGALLRPDETAQDRLREIFDDLMAPLDFPSSGSNGGTGSGSGNGKTPPLSVPDLLGGTTGTGTGKTPSKNDLAAIAQLAYGPQIIAAAKANSIDPRLLAGLVKVESGFNANAVSRAGAVGLTQLMPGTAGDLGVTNRNDPTQNLYGGAKYLRQMLDMFGSLEAALRAYNQGPGNQQRYPGGVVQEAVEYPGKVLRAAQGFGFGAEGMAETDMDAFESSLDAAERIREQQEKQAEIAARLLANSTERVAQSQAALQIEQAITPQMAAQLRTAENKRKIEVEFNKEIEKATEQKTKDLLAQAKSNELKVEDLRLSKELNELDQAAIGAIEDQIELLEAKLNGTEEELRMKREIAALEAKGVNPQQAANLVQTRQLLQEQLEAKTALEAQYKDLASGIAGEMTSAFRSVIDGTKSVEEAFADMLKGIGNKFLDMAMKLITDALTQQLVKLFAGLFGGIGGGGGGFGSISGYGMNSFGSFGLFAEGGYVNKPTLGLIGEAGESEYIIPEKKMPAAMARYSAGARGEEVMNGPDNQLLSKYSAGGNSSGTITVESNIINNVEYVTMDQARTMTEQAATAGAQRGHGRTMNVLQHSRGQRSRIGMS